MSKTCLLTHIVFATKNRQPAIAEAYRKELYAYIFGIIKNKKCTLIRLNGISDHIHMLVDLHPSISVAALVKDVKQFSALWLKGHKGFPLFTGWGDGYYAVSVSLGDVETCKKYIINQESHHSGTDLISEMKYFAATNGLSWHPDDF